MNKLAVLALSVLLVLGGLLWYLAGNSLTPYLDHYISQVNKSYPASNIELTGANIEHIQGIATVNKIALTLTSNDAELEPAALVFNNVVIAFDPKSFKKNNVNIKYITVNDANLSVQQEGYTEQINALTSAIAEMLKAKDTESSTLGLLRSKEAIVQVNKVTLANLHVTMYNKLEPVQEQIFSQVTIPTSGDIMPISFSILDIYHKTLATIKALLAE